MLNLHGHNREDVIELHGQTFFIDYDLLIKHFPRRRSPPLFSHFPSYPFYVPKGAGEKRNV